MASDDEYLSELTDIESDDYADPKGKKNAAKSAWKVRKALTPARATTYSAQALYDQIHAGDINLEPEYQRDVVWSETKQIMIIDSIFRNFYIPPVIFAVKVHDDGSETKTCIDGKQRLTSIHRFMDGLIPHKDPLTGERLWFKEGITGANKGVKRKMMPLKYRKVFSNKQIVCVEYHEITEEDEREVFQRVQLGMALTPAEKLQVINTPRAVFVREIVGKFLREDGALGTDSLNWNTSRGTDFRCLGHAIHIMENSTPEKCIMSDFSQVEKWLQGKSSLDKSFKDDVMETFEIFADLVSDSKHGKIFTKYKKVSPVEFVYTAAFIFVHKDENSLVQLAGGVSEMFNHARTVHQDVRMNNRVQKSFTTFISDWKSKRGAKDIGGTLEQGNKRKRTAKQKKGADDMDVDDIDDDDDYESPKAKRRPARKSGTSKAATSTSTPHSEKSNGPSKSEIQTEPIQVGLPAQKPDRLAAIRKTKEEIAQSQAVPPHQHADVSSREIPSPREIGLPSGQAASTTSANPQMLPSPAQPFSLPSVLSHAPPSRSPVLQGWNPNGPLPPPGTGSSTSSAETPLWKQSPYTNLNPNGLPPGPNDYPRAVPIAPPATAPIPQRDRERDRERDKDRDRDRRGSFDDRDRDSRRYEHHRRDSGGYKPRVPDDRDAGWPGSRRR